jgi:hypothetical protein
MAAFTSTMAQQIGQAASAFQHVPLSLIALLGPLAFVGCGLLPWTNSEGEAASNAGQADKKQLTQQETQQELTLNDGFTLLYELMVQESEVDGILILRSASVPTQTIVRQIAKDCTAAKEHLDSLAKQNPLLWLNYHDLPKAEVDTRKAIEWATTKRLLLGGEFELKLILTQVSATEYAAFLAETLADRDKDGERKTWLEGLAKNFKDLHQKVVQRLTVKP